MSDRTVWRRVAALLLLGVALALALPPATRLPGRATTPPAPSHRHALVSAAVAHDESGPLTSLRTPRTRSNGEGDEGDEGDSADHGGRPESHDRVDDYVLAHGHTTRHDPVRQGRPAKNAAIAPVTGANFEGVGDGFTGPQGTYTPPVFPPDPNIAVGPHDIVEVVNTDLAVFAKDGTPTYGPVQTNTVFAGFGGACEIDNDGDPIVQYDAAADRWMISQFANVSSSTGPYDECVAVSATADPTGAYHRYAFEYDGFPDYPKIGVWPDAYYVSYNMFDSSDGGFQGGQVCALDRASMLAGSQATQQCFTTSTGGLMPSDVDGTPPPPGAPDLVLGLTGSSTSINAWRFHVDWADPGATTLTGPTQVAVAPYAGTCSGADCIPQEGALSLDGLGDRLMYRLAYRNFGDHQSWVVTHSVVSGSSVGPRWYELRLNAQGDPQVYQQGTYAPDGSYRWMGSVAMDQAGGIGLGYSISSPTSHPSADYTGRQADDPPGLMTVTEGSLVDGTGAQTQETSPRNRWGDYTAMRVDPADECTFWYVNEYHATDGRKNWRTRIGSFAVPGCGFATNDFDLAARTWTSAVTAGFARHTPIDTAITHGAAQPVTMSASGMPNGVTAGFSSTTVTTGDTVTLTLHTATTTLPGSYPIKVTATGAGATHATWYTLVVKPRPSYISVGDVSVRESATQASVTLTRTGATSTAASVSMTTTNGTATAGADYTALSSTTASFAAGQARVTVAVPILEDTLGEPDETFNVRLTSPTDATVSDDTGVVTITDDDAATYLAVGDSSVTERSSGSPVATFRVTRSGRTSQPVSVSYFTSNGSASAPGDFTALPSTELDFAAGETSKTVSVPIVPDTADEPDEYFLLHLSQPAGAVVRDDTGVATIVDDDAAVSFSVGDVSTPERNTGTHTVSFTVSRSGSTAAPVSVNYSTSNAGATAGSDYVGIPTSTLAFAAGERSKRVAVTIDGDSTDEPDETFVLRLSTAVGGTIGDDTGVATITDDDATPYVAVADAVVTEGDAGTTDMTFHVTRSGNTAVPVSLHYVTSNGTASAGSDYTALPVTTLDFAAGETSKSVTVPVLGDTATEANETLLLRLSSPVGSTLSDDTGVGTIVDDDGTGSPGPSTFVSVADVSAKESDGSVTFRVTRSGDTSGTTTVTRATSNGSAQAGTDYTALPPASLSFAPGQKTITVSVPLLSDTVDEPAETFGLRLSSPTGGTISDDTGLATLADDDPPTYLKASNVTTAEHSSGSHLVTFTITRSGSTSVPASVTYATANGTATAGPDYTSVPPTTITFAAGETRKTVGVTVLSDTVDEPAETFLLRLSSPVGATISDDTGVATITDDDPATYLSISDISTPERSSGSHTVSFTVSRSGSSAAAISVSYATTGGAATAGTDYTAIPTTVLTFDPGQTRRTVSVTVFGDTTDEPNETFWLRLSSPAGAIISDDTGVATIVDDDAPAYLAVRDVLVQEGDSGSRSMTFTVVRSGSTTAPVSVTYATANGTATAGSDYAAVPATALTFAAGETTKTVNVPVLGDTAPEADETCLLRLSSPVGGVISDGVGAATIENDDG
jgi:hypothetical protein